MRALALLVLLAGCAEPLAIARAVTRNALALPDRPRPPDARVEQPYRPGARLAVLWGGQATALLQLEDRLVLTDPVFDEVVAGVARRRVEPGLRPEDVPPLAAVVISHLHTDHFSPRSIRALGPRAPWVLLPEGGARYLRRGPYRREELRTWESWERRGVRITAVPVDHEGGRYAIDTPAAPRSFTGYVVEYRGLTVYFGGDTAFAPELFRAVRARFPHIDLALLPIAPIEPREFMRSTHMDPDEALQAFRLLGARWMVPIHFDTFLNGRDQPGTALPALRAAMAARGVRDDEVVALGFGEQRVLLPR